MKNMIEISHVTKDYGNEKGVFDISFSVGQGEVFGFLGPNGAGKTTTIRQLLGFIRPDGGEIRIKGLDCFRDSYKIEASLGYLPGEAAFIENMGGMEFIRFAAGMKNLKDLTRAKELMEFFELNPAGKIKKMSKGMKQKIGIVCAFMNDPEILILDEPTSGLDPLMQNRFVELILQEKSRGKTVLMSSHIFEEVEKTCDRTAIIRQGHIVEIADMEKLQAAKQKIFDIKFADETMAQDFARKYPKSALTRSHVTLSVSSDMDAFLKSLVPYKVKDISIRTQTLEELFMHFYGGNTHAK